jgi:hypothetical protein
MSKSNFTQEDFQEPTPQPLIDYLNKLDNETNELELKAFFCREHAFLREAEYLETRIRSMTGILVGVCNSLGKYF